MKVELKINDLWTDITDNVRGKNVRLKTSFGNKEFKYAPDTFDFTIVGSAIDLISRFIGGYEKTEIRVHNDAGDLLFFGDVEADNKLTLKDNYGDMSLSARDIGDRLKRPCDEWAFIDEDLKTIAETICKYVSVPYLFPAALSDITVQYFVVDDEDDCFKTLNTLLWEFGYTLFADPVAGMSARSWWVRPGEVPSPLTAIDGSVTIEPVQIDEEKLDFELLDVKWTIAGNIVRPEDSEKCEGTGLRLYLVQREEIPILPGDYYPTEGAIERVYQRYNGDTAEELFGGDPDRTRIIYAYNQCINLIADSDIIVERSDHTAKRSRVLFRNRLNPEDYPSPGDVTPDDYEDEDDYRIAVGAKLLRRFEIRGSAIYSQGSGTSTVGISSQVTQIKIASVTRSVNQIVIALNDDDASEENKLLTEDNAYQRYRVVTPNGTNAVVDSSAGDAKSLTIFDIETVSPFDTVDTKIVLISPDEGVRRKKLQAEFLYSHEEGARLAEGYKNTKVFGRHNVRYKVQAEDNHPNIGEYMRVRYSRLNVNAVFLVTGYDYAPDSVNDPLIRIEARRVEDFKPERVWKADLNLFGIASNRLDGTVGPPGDGVESIYTTSTSAALFQGQYPNNDWGYKQPGVAGGLTWTTERPDLQG